MTTPIYLLDKLARHGSAVERLREELRNQRDLGNDEPDGVHAIAFDAANFVWSYLVLCDYDEAQESREIRNRVAEAISKALRDLRIDPSELNLSPSDL